MWQQDEIEVPDLDSKEKIRKENYDWITWQLKKARQMPPGMSITLSDNCVYISFQPPSHWPCGNYSTSISLYENSHDFKRFIDIGYKQYQKLTWEKRALCERKGFKDEYTVT